jgi:hypothetical protein
MPRIGVSITKSVAFRNSTQEFSNVYFYEMLSYPDVAAAGTLIDNLVSLEKTFHGVNVTFIRGRLWKQTADKATSEMITQKNLSGTGARTVVSGLDKERAYLFRLRAGVDVRGNPVYLRKWFHACAQFSSGVAPGSTILDNSTGFSQPDRDTMVASMQAIGDANGSAGAPKLCAKGGRQADAGANWSAHQYLEHHQLGDMWRAQ